MIQALPQKNNPKQTAPKTQNQASTSNKKILQANMKRASASAAPFVAEGKTSPNLIASAMNF